MGLSSPALRPALVEQRPDAAPGAGHHAAGDRSSIGVIMRGPPGTPGMRLNRRRPVTMRLDFQRFFSGTWASPQERDTWWYHHVHMELWGMRPFKRGARAMRGEVHGADRVMQAIIDATAHDIEVAEDAA